MVEAIKSVKEEQAINIFKGVQAINSVKGEQAVVIVLAFKEVDAVLFLHPCLLERIGHVVRMSVSGYRG